MYPSPRLLHTADRGSVAAASPKKKPRPNVLRQLYALPAIHQFEPVLAGQAEALPVASPWSVREEEDASSAVAAVPSLAMLPLSPTAPHKLLVSDGKQLSPRLRPQPPPSLSTAAATASRTDQDLFRYSQGVRQRMAIRPLFEQRREEEAEIARRILASRESDPSTSRQGPRVGRDGAEELNRGHVGEDEAADGQQRGMSPTQPLSSRPAPFSASRRATTPITASEISELRAGPPRSPGPPAAAKGETPHSKRDRGPRAKRTGGESRGGPDTERADPHSGSEYTENGDEIASVRFKTPSPPSSAGPSRVYITSAEDTNASEKREQTMDSAAVAAVQDQHGLALQERTEVTSPGTSSLVTGLEGTTLHAPFLEKRGSKVNWLARKPSVMQPTPDPQITEKPSPPPQAVAATICYKLLWRDTKTLPRREGVDGETDSFEMCVLLGSNGKAHISIQPQMPSSPSDQPEERLVISESDLLLSAKTRPDLAVMTPKWARWLLSRLERDAHGVWFLRIQDIFSMEDACVFSGEVQLKQVTSSNLADTSDTEHTVSVSIYLLGAEASDSEALLVHARDTSTVAEASLTEVVLKRHELTAIAASLGYLTPPNETGDTPLDSPKVMGNDMHALLRDRAFLERAVAQSKAVRLALKSGLHIAEMTNSASELPFRTGSRAATAARAGTGSVDGDTAIPNELTKDRALTHTIAEYEAQGLTYATPEIQILVRGNEQLAEISFLAQAYWEDAAASALRWLQRKQAVGLYVATYVEGDEANTLEMSEAVRKRIEAAKQAKLEDIAVRSIVEDMVADFIAIECRFELHHAKNSGGFDDYYASKVQSAYRMSYQRRDYIAKRNTRQRAVRLIQALQRGIIARRRYCEMRVEREKYLFYGFRSSLHHSTASVEDPRHRAMDISRETERRRQTFLMQVLHGYVAEHGIPTPFRISPELVQSIFNEYSVVVGCTPTLGDAVAAILITSRHTQPLPKKSEAKVPPPRLFGSGEIHAALLTALRMQYDDTYGLSASVRRIAANEKSPTKAQMIVTAKRLSSAAAPTADENTPPRWLLKASPPFQRANRNRIASLRLTRKAAGQRASHLVALDYRNLLRHSFYEFEKCRAIWEESIRARKQQTLMFDGFSVEQLVQYALDKLTIAVKDWGIDPEPLFEALNLCLLHRLGKEAIAQTEQAFDSFARGVNELHGKRNVYPLRDEIAQELEEFESLLALRCLNIANDGVVTVPPSELLHVLLVGKVDEEYLRHALPSVLPIASVGEKVQLADRIVRNYADASYGEAFNSICWSCLDTAESVTVEAAQFLERITRRATEDEQDDGSASTKPEDDHGRQRPAVSIAARALYLLTGSQALRFLQFLAKVAHFTKPMQRRVIDLLAPHARDLELYRVATVVCSIDSFEVVTRLFDESFSATAVHGATRFWVQYGALYGEERAETARASCATELGSTESDRAVDETVCVAEEPTILQEPIAT